LGAAGLRVQQLAAADWQGALTQAPALVCVELLGVNTNGFKVVRQLRQTLSCPIVLFTSTGRLTDFDWGKAAGATAVLQRPCPTQLLHACLANVFNAETTATAQTP
jgi:DNA-binding response OmpR family regulator